LDNLTHSLTGLVLARAGLSRSSRGATLALVLASNLPDADLVTAFGGATSYLEHHRGFSHSLLGAPLFALALALLLRVTLRGSRFAGLLLCSLAGVAVHVLMDLWTSYGTRVLAPFDRRFLTWDLVFIVDPWILALLLASAIVMRRTPQGAQIASVGLGLVLAYVGARAVLHQQALDQARAQLSGRVIQRIAALPSPVDPFAWRVLADTGDAYWIGDLSLRGRSSPLLRREKQREDEAVVRARQNSEVASVFLSFSTFPWLEVERTEQGTEVVWRDLRFERPGRASFEARVLVGRDGAIRSERFRF
jgi:inner membrane protein